MVAIKSVSVTGCSPIKPIFAANPLITGVGVASKISLSATHFVVYIPFSISSLLTSS